ncbi:MAG: HAD family hydrolase [Acidimicrobiia bacterium]|nr:HAD family hydrolase [Acidimicrobiia bacterium]
MPAAPVDAVLLDVGGVLHLPDHDRILTALARAGAVVDPALLDRAHYAGIAALTTFTEGDARIWRDYQVAYARSLGVGDELLEEVLEELSAEFTTGAVWRRVIPGSVEALRALSATGRALAVVSNADGSVADRLWADGICQVGPGVGVPVQAIVDSGVVGVAKPDPRIFRIALEALGVEASRAVHVGDTPEADVLGARAAGVRPVLLDPFGLHEGIDCDRVASLADLVDLLG